MKFLWLTSFRPLGKSQINDFFQSIFVDQIKSLNLDVTFSLTQFQEDNVEKFIKEKNIKCYFNNLSKSVLPPNKKYSNKIMLDYALDQFIEDDNFDYLVYSTADIIVPSNFAENLKKIKEENFCSFVWPNIHIVNGNIKNTFWPYYGIDLIVFKLSTTKAIKFKEIIKSYNQYDWGINENFYLSACDALGLKRNNLFKNCKVLKFDNDFKAFTEDRTWQINAWNENQKYFINFLKKNNLSKFYAYGSYFYLLFRLFNFKDLNFSLFIAHLIYYPYFFTLKIFSILKKNLFNKK